MLLSIVVLVSLTHHQYSELFIIIIFTVQVETVRELINSIDVSHIAMLRIVAELLSMVRHTMVYNITINPNPNPSTFILIIIILY